MEMIAIKLNTMKKIRIVRNKWVVIGCRIMQRESKTNRNRKNDPIELTPACAELISCSHKSLQF
jgi:hypothetical protein